jgi:hypothetical protein
MNSSAILLFLLVLCTRGGQKIRWRQLFEMAREYFGLDVQVLGYIERR